MLQDLLNALPISARIPSEVDTQLQQRVSQLFQKESYVNERLPSFVNVAEQMRDRWLAQPTGEPTPIEYNLFFRALARAARRRAAGGLTLTLTLNLTLSLSLSLSLTRTRTEPKP